MKQVSLAILISLVTVQYARAQNNDGWLVINEPTEWSDEQKLTTRAGTRIHVTGQAYHPRGIQTVTVGGVPAKLTRGAGGVFDFTADFTPESSISQVVITARAVGGAIVTKNLKIAVTQLMASSPQFNPKSAALRSLLVPGLGQFYTKQPVLGAAFLAAAGAAIGLAVTSDRTTVHCKSPLINAACPQGQAGFETKEKPLLVPGLVGALGIGVLAAVQANHAAKQLNGGRRGAVDVPQIKLGMTNEGRALGVGMELRF